MDREKIITDSDIDAAFKGTNFGDANHRNLLEQGVLKCLAGYSNGYTLTNIMCELGLITQKHTLTKKGRRFCFSAFYKAI